MNQRDVYFLATLRWWLIVVIVFLTYMAIFARRGWFDWRRIVNQNEQLKTKIEMVTKQQDDLNQKILALQTSPDEQERMVRKVLGYVRPNETVIEFQ